VYVIGIPADIATEDILGSYEYFGQYGPIKKIAVNHQTAYATSSQHPTVSAYVTFHNFTDAGECLYALENFTFEGHAVRASFGTSKYCSSFLSGQKCNNPDCMYLHYSGDSEEQFAREEIDHNAPRFVALSRPARPANYLAFPFLDQRPTKFPPRRILETLPRPAAPPHVKEEPKPVEEPRRSRVDFIASLTSSKPTMTDPLEVNYVVGKSLVELLGLGAPTIRSVYASGN
jgi:RNA recognition motif-containing protein